VKVIGLQATDSNGTGIAITTSGTTNMRDVQIIGCFLDGNGQNSTGTRIGLNVDGQVSGSATLTGVRITNCIITNNCTGTTDIAVRFQNVTDLSIEDCEVSSNAGIGVQIDSTSSDITLDNVDVLDNGQRGILVTASTSKVHIKGGRVQNNPIGVSGGAIQLAGTNTDISIVGVDIRDNGNDNTSAYGQIYVTGTSSERILIADCLLYQGAPSSSSKHGIRFNAIPTGDVHLSGNVILNHSSAPILYNGFTPTTEITGSNRTDNGWEAVGSVVFNEPGFAADFRVEGDNDANLLFLDGSDDHAMVALKEDSLSAMPRWIFKQVDFGDMTAAATADTFTLWTLPANTMIHDIVGTVVTAWAGGSISAAVASVGTNGGAANDLTLDDNFFSVATVYELHDATASGGKGALLFDATDKFAPYMAVAAATVELQMDLTGDNHANATAGQARIYALVSQPLANTATEAN